LCGIIEVPAALGWGKEETQFHGTEQKLRNRQLDPQPALPHRLSEDDDKQIRISWRGDGAYFAVTCIHPDEDRRVIRVYNREAILLSTSESVDRLEHVLAWR
jgi:elongator complex protein 1